MSGSARPRVGLKSGYLPGEEGWGVDAFNPNFDVIDSLLGLTIKNQFPLSAPPGTLADGEVYFINPNPGSATGAWTGQGGKLALRVRSSWVFITPQPGWLATVGVNPPLPCRFRPAVGGELPYWERLLPDKVDTVVVPFFIPGSIAANSRFYRVLWPVSVFPGRANSGNMFVTAQSEARPGTRPSVATTITVQKRDNFGGGPSTIGNFVITPGNAQNFFNVNTPLEISFGNMEFLEFLAPASLNGMTDLAITLVLKPAADFLTEVAQPPL